MTKPAYVGLSILELSKTVMYEFCYDYVKPNYAENAKLCYMDTESFMIYIKQNTFAQALQKMLKQDLNTELKMLILQIMDSIDR